MTDTTPVTDDDRRDAREWATMMEAQHAGYPIAYTAARVILATVPAPPATLADELRKLAIDCLAGRSNQWIKEIDPLADRVEAVVNERDVVRAEASSWKTQRDEAMDRHAEDRTALAEARAEVERLTSGRTSKESLPVALPDPADVPEGEAWIVEVEGEEERLLGLRNSGEPHPWETFSLTTRGSGGWCSDTAVTLVSRLVRDTRRVIDRPEDLVALPAGSIVIDREEKPWTYETPAWFKRNLGWGYDGTELLDKYGPVTVIHEPMSDSSVRSGSDS